MHAYPLRNGFLLINNECCSSRKSEEHTSVRERGITVPPSSRGLDSLPALLCAHPGAEVLLKCTSF